VAKLKRNQLNNIMFPMVDPTDFASIESGITASDFNSGITAKFYGVTHGNSTAATSGTISKAALLVHSGVFQQTLKATETNYDFLVLRFYGHASMADQILMFEMVTSDDSDIVSLISDVNSNLLSVLAVMSGVLSDTYSLAQDIDSQLLLNASMISDTLSLVSDVDSQVNLLATSDYLSAVHSDFRSLVSGITASVGASDMSDIASRVWATAEGTRVDSRILVIQSMVSDVDSQVLLNASVVSNVYSLLSDHDSNFGSRVTKLVANFSQLSDVHSDLRSLVSGITASVSVSDMSDIASRVWATAEGVRVDSRLLVIQSNVSEVDSQVNLLTTSNYLSQVHSDLYSAIGAVTASVSASDISDIASAVVDALASDFSDVLSGISDLDSNISAIEVVTNFISSRVVEVLSDTSDILSDMYLQDSTLSDIQSQLSNAHSDLRSLMSTAGGTVTASDISDIASAVWATTLATKLVQLNDSDLSDIRSAIAAGPAATVTASDISDIASAVVVALASDFSDVLSAVSNVPDLVWDEGIGAHIAGGTTGSNLFTAAAAATGAAAGVTSLISDVSDVQSYLVAMSAALSDVESQLDVTHSLLSDVESQVDVVDGVVDNTAVFVAAIVAGVSQVLSNVSDVESQLDVTQSLLSDVESQVDLLATSDYLSAVHSDLASAIGAITVALTPSDISDITSGILAGLAVTVFPTGAIDFTYTVTDDVTLLPISGVEVWVSTDNPAVNIVWKGTTDAFGVARDVLENLPALDVGTYFFWRQRSAYVFDDPDVEVVS